MRKSGHIIRFIQMVALVLTALAASSCDNHENVVGQWQFSPSEGERPDSLYSDLNGCLVLSGDGRALLSTDVRLTRQMTDTASYLPDSVTLRAVASIEGTWRYVSRKNDAIEISYDYSSFGISIDPDDVSYSPEPSTKCGSVVYDVIKDSTIEEYRRKLSPGFESFFGEFGRIERIRVDNGVMYCETKGHTFAMRAA